MFNLIISLFFCVWHLSKGIKILSTGTEIDSTLLMFCTKICNERQSYTLITLPTDIDGITLKLKMSSIGLFLLSTPLKGRFQCYMLHCIAMSMGNYM